MIGKGVAELAAGLAQLGISLRDLGQTEEAIACFRRCLVLDPLRADIHNNLGALLGAAGDEAAACFRRALQLNPDFQPALNNLGGLMLNLGRLTEAEALLTRACELQPDDPVALANLGHLRRAQGRMEEAEDLLRRALAMDGDQPKVWNMLGRVLLEGGRAAEAVACFEQALRLDPADPDAGANRVYGRQFLSGITLAEVAADHRAWAARLGVAAEPSGLPLPRRPGKPRLGFVSGDFRRHPVAYFTVRVIEALAAEDLAEVVCYANQAEDDVYTQRFRAAARGWRDIRNLDDRALAEVVRADGIDVLFDLTGHNDRNRLSAFLLRPAPYQVSWAGYMATTGLAAMDAIVADRHLVPPGFEEHYAERVLTMPHSYICYDPPAHAPDPGPPPMAARGVPTFGCLNMLGKLNSGVIALWSELLRRVPGSRLLLKNHALECPSIRARIAAEFAAGGIAQNRLILRGGSDQASHMASFDEIDLSLDPFPFTGSTTTLESLWMGVPVLTLPGETFASRHSTSFLATLGLGQFIVESSAAYLERAAHIGSEELAQLRCELRGRMAASPLCDGRHFARDLMLKLGQLGTLSVVRNT